MTVKCINFWKQLVKNLFSIYKVLSITNVDGLNCNKIHSLEVFLLIRFFYLLLVLFYLLGQLSYKIIKFCLFSFLKIHFGKVDVRNNLHFLRQRTSLRVFLFSTVEVSTSPQRISFLNQTPSDILFRIFRFSNTVNFFIINFQTLIVITIKLKQSCLTIDLRHRIFDIIVISNHI